MDINIILGILLILIVIYFLVLVVSLRRRNQQVNQAPQWNSYRDRLVTQAQEDQVKAHQISVSLQKQYKDLMEPYARDRDQAFAVLGVISDNARKVLNDQNLRPPISLNSENYSWKTLFLSPLWTEYRTRQDWWKTTQELGSRLSRNQSGFSAVKKLEKQLAAKGERTKADFESLKNKIEKLIADYQAEARTPAQFRDQVHQLQQLNQQIDQTIKVYLTGNELSPKLVAKATPNFGPFRKEWEQYDQELKESKNIRRDTRSQLEKNRAIIDTIEALLKAEEEAGRPIKYYRQALNAEIESVEEQERQRETGAYLKSPAIEQHDRLQEIDKNLRVLIQERLRLGERLARGDREISLTETWIKTIEPPFIIDQTNVILDEVQKQQSLLYQLIYTSEDQDLLGSQIFIDPEKLASNRTAFDERVNTYQTLDQKLQQQIPPAIQQVQTAIQNLRPLNTRYHQGLDLDALVKQTLSLEENWAAMKTPTQIRESQIEQWISDLRRLERFLQEINSNCQKAQTGYQSSSADRAEAQQLIEDQSFVEYHQVMQVISREDQVSLSDQAGEYARQAEDLNKALEQLNTDFANTVSDAERLFVNMKTLWDEYQKKYAAEKKEYQTLVERLTTLQSNLEKFEEHELSAFHTRVDTPLTRIVSWLQIVPPQSIQALLDHNEEGYLRQVEIEKVVKELSKQDQNYTWAKEQALSAIQDAKAVIEDAEIELTKIPWGTPKPARKSRGPQRRSSELEHSYRYVDDAEAAYKEITDPAIEYHNSVEKAISDLVKRVRQNADHAKDEAQDVRRETGEQIEEIDRKCQDLEKTLVDGQGYALGLEDSGFRSQWAQIYRKYSQFEDELEGQASFREAFSYLEQALIEARYQIERMREFEDSR